MARDAETHIRLASAADAPAFGRLLQAFNVEFGEPTPDADVFAERAAPLIETGEVTVLLGGDGPDGFAELRFRPSLYTGALDAYLEEVYVIPERRGRGLGRALLEAAMEHRKSAAPLISTSAPARTTPPRGRCMRAPDSPTARNGPEGPRMLTTSATLGGSLPAQPGCEATVISNAILGRDDQIGCPLFPPIDEAEAPRGAECRPEQAARSCYKSFSSMTADTTPSDHEVVGSTRCARSSSSSS